MLKLNREMADFGILVFVSKMSDFGILVFVSKMSEIVTSFSLNFI